MNHPIFDHAEWDRLEAIYLGHFRAGRRAEGEAARAEARAYKRACWVHDDDPVIATYMRLLVDEAREQGATHYTCDVAHLSPATGRLNLTMFFYRPATVPGWDGYWAQCVGLYSNGDITQPYLGPWIIDFHALGDDAQELPAVMSAA